ncbi:hypothetical protein D3C86_1741320 [compost metagenome]
MPSVAALTGSGEKLASHSTNEAPKGSPMWRTSRMGKEKLGSSPSRISRMTPGPPVEAPSATSRGVLLGARVLGSAAGRAAERKRPSGCRITLIRETSLTAARSLRSHSWLARAPFGFSSTSTAPAASASQVS